MRDPQVHCGVTGVDTHAHVFRRDLALASERRYEPDYDAPLAAFLSRLDDNGLSHGLLVQPSFLGNDNRFLLSALREDRSRLRGIAVVEPGVTDTELDRLAAGGIVGIRLNLIGRPLPDLCTAPWPHLLKRLVERNWPVEVHREARDLAAVVEPLIDAGIAVIVDHFGRPDATAGLDDPGFRRLLDFAASGCVWVKLSAPYRNSNGTADAAVDMASALLDRFGPRRLMWGSDWPHTRFERFADYAASRRELDIWIPDTEDRRIVLAETPAALFRLGDGR